MKKRRLLLAVILLAAVLSAAGISACSQSASSMQDGYYTAEFAAFDAHGWKEFVTIFVKNGRIASVEYNAKNQSGFIKSWDMNYMRVMGASSGSYPNEYTRVYAGELLQRQGVEGIDAISGASESHGTFRLLAEAAIAQAEAGDKTVAFIEMEAHETENAETEASAGLLETEGN
jgi:major membrane immunogen (membrane-anchored lipoprotein)